MAKSSSILISFLMLAGTSCMEPSAANTEIFPEVESRAIESLGKMEESPLAAIPGSGKRPARKSIQRSYFKDGDDKCYYQKETGKKVYVDYAYCREANTIRN